MEEKAFAEAEAARLAEEEAAKAAERAEIARLREELDAMKAKLDTTMSSRSLSARKRLGRRGSRRGEAKRDRRVRGGVRLRGFRPGGFGAPRRGRREAGVALALVHLVPGQP